MFDNTSFYCEHGNLSFEFDDEHQDYELAEIEFELLTPYLKNIKNSLHLFCGAGRHTAVFAKNKIQSTGIDISSFLIQQACCLLNQEKHRLKSPANSVIGNVLNLPFAGDTFECVTALGNCFSLLSDDHINQVFKQVLQVIKLGAIFILDIPDFEHIIKNYKSFTKTMKTCKDVNSKYMGAGVMTWHRLYDPKNNRIVSKEKLVFDMGRPNIKTIESHFLFHIILPKTMTRKAEKFNMEVIGIKNYQDKRGKYRGMLAKRIFMIFRKN